MSIAILIVVTLLIGIVIGAALVFWLSKSAGPMF